MKHSLMLTLVALSLFSCSIFSKKEPNDVYVRIDNQTGLDLARVAIGRRMHKKSSYRSKAFGHIFHEVIAGEMTAYVNTYGKHYGYHGMSIKPKDSPKQYSHSPQFFEQQLKENGAYLDTIKHVYTGNMKEGLTLPRGRYTFTIKLHKYEKTTLIHTTIQKDEED